MQHRLFQIELPLHPGWDAIAPLRAAVLACLEAVFPNPPVASSLALVAAELLENAVKFGRWDGAGLGMFELRVDGIDDGVVIEVANPVTLGDGDVERLQAELDRIAAAPSPQEAYLKAVRGVALGRPGALGLARAAHEGGCDISARLESDVVRVRAVTRRMGPERPTPAEPA
jgi:hypothetical protein